MLPADIARIVVMEELDALSDGTVAVVGHSAVGLDRSTTLPTDLRLERNSVAIEGALVVEGNALRVGPTNSFRLTTGGNRANLQIGSAQQPGRIQVHGRSGTALLHVQGLIRSPQIDTAKLTVRGTDLAAKIAELERRIAQLER